MEVDTSHTDEKPLKTLPTFEDLNTAIDGIGELFNKYTLLLTQSTWGTLVPVVQFDWQAVFREPWIKPGGVLPQPDEPDQPASSSSTQSRSRRGPVGHFARIPVSGVRGGHKFRVASRPEQGARTSRPGARPPSGPSPRRRCSASSVVEPPTARARPRLAAGRTSQLAAHASAG